MLALNVPAKGHFPLIVDSGWSYTVLPPSLVDIFYAEFQWPPQVVEVDGSQMYTAPCHIPVPSFGVQIDGQVFEMTHESILVSRWNTTVDGTLMCGLGIQPGVEMGGALGDTFLSSVVAVFDIGASMMRFVQRVPNGIEEPSTLDAGLKEHDEL